MRVLIKLIGMGEIYNITVDDKTKECIVNLKSIEYDVDLFVNNIVGLSKNWKNKLIGDRSFDSLEVKVKFVDDQAKETLFDFKGKYPDNYFEFLNQVKPMIDSYNNFVGGRNLWS